MPDIDYNNTVFQQNGPRPVTANPIDYNRMQFVQDGTGPVRAIPPVDPQTAAFYNSAQFIQHGNLPVRAVVPSALLSALLGGR